MSEYVHVDMRQFNGLVNALKTTNAETKKVFRTGLRKGAQVIQKQARVNMKGVVNQATGKPLKAQHMTRFVRITVYKDARGARVDILPDRRKSTKKKLDEFGIENRSYIVRFFATGTKDRYTKSHRRYGQGRRGIKRKGKGGYRGFIGRTGFFEDAVNVKRANAEEVLRKIVLEYYKHVKLKSYRR